MRVEKLRPRDLVHVVHSGVAWPIGHTVIIGRTHLVEEHDVLGADDEGADGEEERRVEEGRDSPW